MWPPSPPRPLAFPTLDALAAYLRPHLPAPALASWGSAPGTKNLLNLFLELSSGDCTLLPSASASPPAALVMRAVHVATVRIRNRRGALLVETQQLLSDGTLRRRGPRPVSEKMWPGESPEAAAARAVREELGERMRVPPNREVALAAEEGGVWRKKILMGERCQPLDFSGVIYYDADGRRLAQPPRLPMRSPLPSAAKLDANAGFY